MTGTFSMRSWPVAESVTFTVTEKVPEAVGVPDMTPAGLIERPPGKAPAATDQVYGGTPPAADSPADTPHYPEIRLKN